MEKTIAALAQDLERALAIERGQSERDRNIQCQYALLQGKHRRFPIIGCAVKDYWQRQRETQITEQIFEDWRIEAVQAEIRRQAEQHDVAKGKAGDSDLEPLPFARRIRFSLFQFAERKHGFVAD